MEPADNRSGNGVASGPVDESVQVLQDAASEFSHSCSGSRLRSVVGLNSRVKDSVRKPHYMTASEQRRIEFFAPAYLRHAVTILVEMGL
jgi:hypothetical protein